MDNLFGDQICYQYSLGFNTYEQYSILFTGKKFREKLFVSSVSAHETFFELSAISFKIFVDTS